MNSRFVAVLQLSLAAVSATSFLPWLSASTEVELQGSALEWQTQTAPGSSVTMRLSTAAEAGDQFQWWFNDQPLTGAKSSLLQLEGLTSAQTGNYRLRRTSANGRNEFSNTLTLNVVPSRPSSVDPSFRAELPPHANTNIQVLRRTDDGDLLVGIVVGNDTHIVRLNSDGSFDREFSLGFNTNSFLAAFPDGGVLVSQPPYRRDANGAPLPFGLPTGFDGTTRLYPAAVLDDGRFLIVQGGKLARFHGDGTLDTSFTFDPSVHLDLVTALLPDAAGRVLINGLYYLSGGSGELGSTVFRILPNGQLDPSFSKLTGGYRERIDVFPYPQGYLTYWTGFEGQHPILRAVDDTGAVRAGVALPLGFIHAVDQAGRIYFSSAPTYRPVRYTLTVDGLQQDPTFEANETLSGRLYPTSDGALYSPAQDGPDSLLLVRLRTTITPGYAPAAIVVGPSTFDLRTFQKGQSVTLTSIAASSEPLAYQWLALDGQPMPVASNRASLTLPPLAAENLGRYQLRVTNSVGSVLSNVVDLALPTSPSLVNLSGRANSGTGDDTVIAGFTTSAPDDTGARLTLLRGVGPSLEPLGIKGYLPDPSIRLFDSAGISVATNDDWGNNRLQADVESAVGAFPLIANSHDAALLLTPTSTQATVHLLPKDERAGVGLLEIYQASDAYYPPTLINLSLRAKTGPGEATAIAGFVIVDPQHFERKARVLLRAIGPTLTSHGIAQPLANPVLTVFNNKGQVIAQNDDWSAATSSPDSSTLISAMKQVGAFELPATSKDAALLLDLPAGAYTMHATGGSGVVLLEIYLVR